MNWLKENWFKAFIVVIVVLLIGFGLLSLVVRAKCSRTAGDKLSAIEDRHPVLDWQRLYDLSYQKCLNSYGL